MQTLFLVLHLIVSVILIFVVMAQEGKDPGERYSRCIFRYGRFIL